ncbi:MAG: tetratricopeptide repeat protein [Chloroflexota bacterium]
MFDSLDLEELEARGDFNANLDKKRRNAFWAWMGVLFALGILLQLLPAPADWTQPWDSYTAYELFAIYAKAFSPIIFVVLLLIVVSIFTSRLNKIRASRSGLARKRLADLMADMVEYAPIHKNEVKPKPRYIGIKTIASYLALLGVLTFTSQSLVSTIAIVATWLFLSSSFRYWRALFDSSSETRSYLWRNIGLQALFFFGIVTPIFSVSLQIATFITTQFSLPFWAMMAIGLTVIFGSVRLFWQLYNRIMQHYFYQSMYDGNFETAIKRIEMARSVFKQPLHFIMIHAQILHEAGHYQEAEIVWREAITEAQNGAPATIAQLLMGLANTVQAQGRWNEAMRYLEVAAKIYPENSAPYAAIANHYVLRHGDPHRSQQFSRLMMRYLHQPMYKSARTRYGMAYIKVLQGVILAETGNITKAKQLAEDVEVHLRTEKQALWQSYLAYYIAQIYNRLGNDQSAQNILQQAQLAYS